MTWYSTSANPITDKASAVATQLATDVAEVSAAAGVILIDEVVLPGATAGTLIGIIDGAGNLEATGVLDTNALWGPYGIIDNAEGFHVSGWLANDGTWSAHEPE